MKEQALETARDWLTLTLTGVGISLAPHVYLGGLFMALAAGSLIARHRRSTRKLVGIMATAAVVATIAVIASAEFDHFGLAPQLIMIGAGAASSWLINIFVGVMDATEARSGRIADWLIGRLFPTTTKREDDR